MKRGFILASLLLTAGCGREAPPHLSTADSLRIAGEIAAHREAADDFFRNDPDSPFRRDSAAHFAAINWYPADLRFRFECELHRVDPPEEVTIYGTKGEPRSVLRAGWFLIPFGGNEYRLNAYRTPGEGSRLAVWFTDETTGKETYEVGRYLDLEGPGAGGRYILDFNLAYNPYCAYSPLYSCAVPRREDHLGFAVRAGEMKYHR